MRSRRVGGPTLLAQRLLAEGFLDASAPPTIPEPGRMGDVTA